jgi:ATP-dependent Lon protease
VRFESAYYDPDDASVPRYVRKLFEEGAPADFVLIGATTRSPDTISPALRSRCAEIFFDPLTPDQIQAICREAAGRLKVKLEPRAAELISLYTLEGRRAVTLLADALSLARLENPGVDTLTVAHVEDAVAKARLPRVTVVSGRRAGAVGHVFGLAVAGFQGTVLEVEAAAFPAREPGKGQIRFNETAGSMAKDSVFNACTVLRRLTGRDPLDYDFHVNIVGGGQVDGPSAGAAIFLALHSVLTGTPVRQDLAVTGEVALSGELKPVGGIAEKIFGARQSHLAVVVVPAENAADVPPDSGVDVRPLRTAEELLEVARYER